ncbi:MAG: pyridoxamine 5'-phosphate oxidase family protein [Muribaculaceae bacterium]|nr:pyridoxamine 5'-phosphate oxidase family protein [Muribaculaceae bacterium]
MEEKCNKERLLKKAEEVLARCEDITIASVNADGYPRPVQVSIMKTVGFNEVWMSTGADSVKTIEFRTNPKAGLCYSSKGDSVAMRGTVEIVTNDELRKEMWKDWMIYHFTEGPTDPNYVLLHFVGKDATIWIENEFAHLTL